MNGYDFPTFRFITLALVFILGIQNPVSAQGSPEVIDIRQRLIEKSGEEYVVARDDALALPQGQFGDLLFLLRLSPEFSLERVLALVLEARVNHPGESARFDADLQHMLDNPDMRSRSGEPIYTIWTNREVNEVHPLIYEALIKLDLPHGLHLLSLRGMTAIPNPDNIHFIIYLGKNHGLSHLISLRRVTEGYPDARAQIRPIVLALYKDARENDQIWQATSVARLFAGLGTEEDLATLNEIREFEENLMPQQGFTPWNREEVIEAHRDARLQLWGLQAELSQVQRTADQATIEQFETEIAQAEALVEERTAPLRAVQLWDAIERAISQLEARLAETTGEE